MDGFLFAARESAALRYRLRSRRSPPERALAQTE
jgi:hypothetical protein